MPEFYGKILRPPKLPSYRDPTKPMYSRLKTYDNVTTVEYQSVLFGWIGLHDDIVQVDNYICTDYINKTNAEKVICKSLGYQDGYSFCKMGTGRTCIRVWNNHQGCPTGNETDISQCFASINTGTVEETLEISCGENQTCLRSRKCQFPSVCNASGECECSFGYSFNGSTCADIDECQNYPTNACDFAEICVNVPGTYFCRVAIPGRDNISSFSIGASNATADIVVLTQITIISGNLSVVRTSGSLNISASGNLNLSSGISLFVGNGSTIEGTLTISGNSVLNVLNCLNISEGTLVYTKTQNMAKAFIYSDCLIGPFKHVPVDPCVQVVYTSNSVEIFFSVTECSSNSWKSWYTAVIVIGGGLILVGGVIFVFKCGAIKKHVLPFSERRRLEIKP